MKAAVIHELGDEGVFRFEEVPDPQVRPRQVLVRVKSASINRGDLGQRQGTYRGTTGGAPLPMVLGWDVAGVIEEVGTEVRDRTVGQHVVATLGQGGYAELAAVNEVGTVLMPETLSFDEAASIPIVFLTSWYALLKVGKLQAGETVLVQSGGSGVGMAGIQIAKYFGATVITTASSREKLDKAKELGADHGINYTESDFREETLRITEREGVNLVLESVGGEVLTRSIEALAPSGRLVTVGNTSGSGATIDPSMLVARLLTVLGFSLSVEMGRGGVMKELGEVMELCGQGKLKTVVGRVFPLSEISEAHRYVADRRNFGKVMLRP